MLDNRGSVEIPEVLQKQSTGFIVHFPVERHDVSRLYASLPIKENIVGFLADVIDLITSKGDSAPDSEFCTFVEIQSHLSALEKANGRSMIYNRVNALTDIGLFTENLIRVEGKRKPIKLLTINDPVIDSSTIDAKYQVKGQKSKSKPVGTKDKNAIAQSTENRLRKKFQGQMLDEPDFVAYQRDHFITSVVSKCINHTPRDAEKKLTTRLKYLDDDVDVITTTLTDQNILASSDLRYTVILTSFCLRIMKEYLQSTGDPNLIPENEFLIDLSMVVQELGNEKSTGNRSTAYKSIKRLYTTNFEISSAQGSLFARRFLGGFNEVNYRYLTNFRAIVYDADPSSDDFFSADLDETIPLEEITNARWVRVSLWEATFQSMWRMVVGWKQALPADEFKNITISLQNPEVVKNNQAKITMQLYSHIRSWVGLSGYQKKRSNTSDLHQFMLPNSRYQNFRRDLLKLLNSVRVDGEPITLANPTFKVNFYGYFIEGRPLTAREAARISPRKGFHLTFYRDPKDSWVGDNTPHQRLLRSSTQAPLPDPDVQQAEQTGSDVVDEAENREAFLKVKEELGKSADDIDIPKSSYYVVDDSDPSRAYLKEDDLFGQ